MTRDIPTVRGGILVLDPRGDFPRMRIAANYDAWFDWLDHARTFAFDDPIGRFTARKKRRGGREYWYAFRRRGGRMCEMYLGQAQDITLGCLRAVAGKLNQQTMRPSRPNAPSRADNQIGWIEARLPSGLRRIPGPTGASQSRVQLVFQSLTSRELQVIQLMALGASNAEIAHDLVIALATAKRHVHNILMKLGAQSRTQAVSRALALGVVSFDAHM
jgi:DNA-binding CsgD family transcriptional regulator